MEALYHSIVLFCCSSIWSYFSFVLILPAVCNVSHFSTFYIVEITPGRRGIGLALSLRVRATTSSDQGQGGAPWFHSLVISMVFANLTERDKEAFFTLLDE